MLWKNVVPSRKTIGFDLFNLSFFFFSVLKIVFNFDILIEHFGNQIGLNSAETFLILTKLVLKFVQEISWKNGGGKYLKLEKWGGEMKINC